MKNDQNGSQSDRPARKRRPEATRAALLNAAREEFEAAGFEGTNTNEIARRAGFSPQTFYRHFEDKLEIFLAVYADWAREELGELAEAENANDAADILISRHRATLTFRRSLRALSVSDDRVRAARAENRTAQIGQLAKRSPRFAARSAAGRVSALLTMERLADACAEGEFRDLGVTEEDARGVLAATLEKLF